MHLTLTIRYGHDGAAGQAAARWLPGRSPPEWLAALARYGDTAGPDSASRMLAEARLYVVPESIRDRRPLGLLVVWDRAPVAIAAHGEAGLPGVAYACRGDRLYLPCDARLDPPVSDDELRRLLPWEVAVFHPTAGLVGFGPEDAMRIADLLAPPPARAARWDLARPGEAGPPTLQSIEVEADALPTLESLINEARDDIAREEVEDVPPAKDEPGNSALDNTKRAVKRRLAQWVKQALDKNENTRGVTPRGASGPGQGAGVPGMGAAGEGLLRVFGALARRLGDWAGNTLASTQAASDFLRQRELNRLLELLKNDPDLGLRFALPLADLGRARGVAPPSNRLGQRDPRFDLSRLNGSGPGDAWRVDHEMHQRLMAQYRDAANRELRLKRYRRAAYILAELLGDIEGAAAALVQGHLFREAAVLYRDKLNRPLDAAQCLERGGLTLEAIALYRTIPDWLKVGELYERLEMRDDAARAFREEVVVRRQRGAVVEAAALLETKLNAVDEALELLEGAWPDGMQAMPALSARLKLLDRASRHDELARVMRGVVEQGRARSGLTVTIVPALSEMAAGASRPELRHQAADGVRVMVGRRLATATVAESAQLLRAVRQLEPQDKLLERDVNRVLQPLTRLLPKAAATSLPRSPRKPLSVPMEITNFVLPSLGSDGQYLEFASDSDSLWALGFENSTVTVVRTSWAGVSAKVTLQSKHHPSHARLMIIPGGVGSDVHAAGGNARAARPTLAAVCLWGVNEALPIVDFPMMTGLKPARVGTPAGLPELVRGWGLVGEHLWVLGYSDRAPTAELVQVGAAGESLGTVPCPFANLLYEMVWTPMVHAGGTLHALSLGSLISVSPPSKVLGTQQFRSEVRSLCAPLPGGKSHVAVVMKQGGVLVRCDASNRLRTQYFADDMDDPLMTFTRGGSLIAISGKRGRVYRFNDDRVVATRDFDAPRGDIVGLVPGGTADTFTVIASDRQVYLMRDH